MDIQYSACFCDILKFILGYQFHFPNFNRNEFRISNFFSFAPKLSNYLSYLVGFKLPAFLQAE